MKLLIVGGSKSGKSAIAEKLAVNLHHKGTLYYVATMNPHDCEDLKRIEQHIHNRKDYQFTTIEIKRNLKTLVTKFTNQDTLLLDSVTSWVTNEMFVGTQFHPHVEDQINETLVQLSQQSKDIILVSDYLFNDAIQYDDYTDVFRRQLGHINCYMATMCEVVLECVAGYVMIHKGEEILIRENLISCLTHVS